MVARRGTLPTLEMGYQDPALGYVELHARMAAGGVHAVLTAQSSESSATLEGRLHTLSAWMSERQTPLESLTVLASSSGKQAWTAGHDGTAGPGAGRGESNGGTVALLGGNGGGRNGGDGGGRDHDSGGPDGRAPVDLNVEVNHGVVAGPIGESANENHMIEIPGSIHASGSPVIAGFNERATGNNISVLA